MWSIWLLFLVGQALSVDREKFKICSESSFCTRQRNFWPSGPKYTVDVEKLQTHQGFEFQLIDVDSQKRLTVNVTYLPGSIFRVVFDETNPIRPRFRCRIGESLVKEPSILPMDIQIMESEIILSGQNDDKAVIKIEQFKMSFFSQGALLMTINERDLFNFEHQLEQQFEEKIVVEPPVPVSENETTDEAKTNVSVQSNITAQQATVRLPVDWSESFKIHRDSRIHGPTSVGIDFTFHGFAHAYGIPEHADSFALRSTNKTDPYRLFNLDVFEYDLGNPMALYGSVPLMWAHRANKTVGVFINNPTEAWIDVEYSRDTRSNGLLSRIFNNAKESDPTVKTRWMFETGVLDIFVILADSPQSGLQAYAALTGSTPLPPLFALAHHQSRWNYNYQDEVKAINAGYDQYNLPLDNIWLDIDYANGKRYLTWNTHHFPSPDDMVDNLEIYKRKLVVAVDPHIKTDHSWSTCSQGKSAGHFVKVASNDTDFDGWCWPELSYWPDFYRPEVVDWWANLFTGSTFLSADRMFYVWNDMNEPSVFSGPEVTIPKDTLFGGIWENRDIHNLYALWVHNATWEGLLRRSNRKERPFVLARGFFAGSQRTTAVWTGDNTASWNHLQITTPMLLSMSMAGLTFCGSDVGGFFNHPSGELYTRWYQAAAFHPFLRSHAHTDTPRREPWTYDKVYLDVIRKALRLRYSLLPYWYTLFARSEVNALPPLGPLLYHFPTDENTFGIDNAFMVGEGLLVHPVVHESAHSVEIYLPNGTWYSHDRKVYSGTKVINLPVNLETIPVFYRGGHIIPKKERPRRSSGLMIHDPYTISIALDRFVHGVPVSAIGYLYLDDFHSIDRSQARLYQMKFFKENHEFMFEFIKLQGQTDVNTPYIERIVVMSAEGMQPNRVYVTSSSESVQTRDVEFFYDPPVEPSLSDDGHQYAVLVIRKPEIKATDGWQLHIDVS